MKNLFLKIKDKYMKELQKTIIPGTKYHLEGDTWSHTMLVFNQAENNFMKTVALLHDIGKPLTKRERNNKLYFTGHEGVSTHLSFEYFNKIQEINKDLILEIFYTINYHGILWKKSKKQIEEFFAKDLLKIKYIFDFNKLDKKGNITFDDSLKTEFTLKDLNFKDKKYNNTKGKIHLLCGLPNSGKSTFAKTLNLPILSRDDIITELFPNLTYNEAWENADQKKVDKKFQEKIKEFKQYNEFVIDLTNLSWKSRKKWFNYYKNYEFDVYFFATPIDIIFKRNKDRKDKKIPIDVIINMMKITELPLLNEGNIRKIIFNF